MFYLLWKESIKEAIWCIKEVKKGKKWHKNAYYNKN